MRYQEIMGFRKALRLAQPYAVPGYGMHFPLHTGTEVAIGFVDGDVDRPIGLGAVPNPSKGSPVKAGNKSQNEMKSHAGNSVHLVDKEGKTGVFLGSTGGHRAALNDDAGSKGITLSTSGGNSPALNLDGAMNETATAYLNAKRTDDAVKTYGEAEQAATVAKEKQEPGAGKLAIQARLSAGATLVGAARYPEAGPIYEQTAPLARAEADALLELESLRMAAYCREASKDWEGAWTLGGKALQVGEKMKPEDRENSTLPYVGQALTRVNNKVRKTDGATLKKHLDKTLGEGWEKKIERSPAPTDPAGGMAGQRSKAASGTAT